MPAARTPQRDCELNVEGVARVLRAQFPELAPHAVRYLGSGWDHDAYEVNDEWIVRMPMRADVAARVPVERAALALAGEVLELALPQLKLLGVASEHYPYPFSGYRKLPGVIAETVPVARFATRDNARLLGRALAAIHRVPLARAHSAGVLAVSVAEDRCSDRAQRVLQRRDPISAALGRERTRRCARFLEERLVLDVVPETHVLRHDDLHLEHVLLDPDCHRVTGIIDWTDANIGDRAGDFVLLWTSCGEPFVHDVLNAYQGPADPSLVGRIQLRARWSVLDWLGRSLERAPDALGSHLAAFDRCFA